MDIWQLELGDEVIATVRPESYEFPWTHGVLVNSPKFEKFRVFFSDDEYWPDTQEFEELCKEIRIKGDFKIRNIETNESFKNLTFNHNGENIWFRYS